jgi:hypothetical protein
MAETLGSLIDKLSIKSIREFHIKKMMRLKGRFSKEQLKEKLDVLARQKKALLAEIEDFIDDALRGSKILKDEKLKLYNKPETMNKIGKIRSVAKGIEALTKKNFELWQLEDEARREDVELTYIGEIKRKIDLTNQQRNDLMDRIDLVLEGKLKDKRAEKQK